MVTIYSKDYCPYCIQAKNLLTSLNIEFKEIDITNDSVTLQRIMTISRIRTVPQIFVDETYLGGYMDIAELHSEGKLLPMIKSLSK